MFTKEELEFIDQQLQEDSSLGDIAKTMGLSRMSLYLKLLRSGKRVKHSLGDLKPVAMNARQEEKIAA